MPHGKKLRSLCLFSCFFSLKKRGWRGNLASAFSWLMGCYKGDRPDSFGSAKDNRRQTQVATKVLLIKYEGKNSHRQWLKNVCGCIIKHLLTGVC